jgi:hypothetical protein
MSALDSRMFGKDWWAQPLVARYASIDAHNAGLTVQVEVAKRFQHRDEAPCITWRGTAEQFQKTKTFPKGVSAKRASGKYFHPDQLRGTVYPDGDGRFVFVIEFCNYHGTTYPKRIVEQALKSEAYLNFRDAVMAGFPLADLQVMTSGGAA